MKTIFLKLFIILLCLTAFFYNIIGNGYVLLTLCLLPVIASAFFCFFNMRKNKIVLLLFAFSCCMSVLGGKALNTESIKFIYMLFLIIITREVLIKKQNWQVFFLNCIKIFSVIFVIGTYLSMIVPDLIMQFARTFFSGETLEVYISLFKNGAYAGFTGQTSINGYFISIAIAIAVAGILNDKKYTQNTIFLVLFIIALFMTQKRSYLVANIIAFLVVFFKYAIKSKNGYKTFFMFTFFIAVVYLVFMYSPQTQGIIQKMNSLEKIDDVTNGRSDLWNITLKIWRNKPIFGVGINSIVDRYHMSTHNVYIQLLAEVGIVGFVAYIYLLYVNIKTAFQFKDENQNIEQRNICDISLYMQTVFIIYSFFGNAIYGINFNLLYFIFTAVTDSFIYENDLRNYNNSLYSYGGNT